MKFSLALDGVKSGPKVLQGNQFHIDFDTDAVIGNGTCIWELTVVLDYGNAIWELTVVLH
jgi:hypothetical protein